MRIRGLVGIALIALLTGCGGAAVAAPQPAPTTPTAEVTIDVEAIARDEIAAIDALGYPTELANWDFRDEFVNDNGGTAWASGDLAGRTTVIVSTDPGAYRQFSDDIEAAVRSTVRHEFGHALTYFMYPNGAEEPLSVSCTDRNAATVATQKPAGECAAESVSAALAEERGDERVVFYGLDLSRAGLNFAPPILTGSLTWSIPPTAEQN